MDNFYNNNQVAHKISFITNYVSIYSISSRSVINTERRIITKTCCVYGNFLAIGAQEPGTFGTVFIYDAENPSQYLYKLYADPPSDDFGNVITINNNTLAISEVKLTGLDSGDVHIFDISGGLPVFNMTLSGEPAPSAFGRSLCSNENLIVVGSPTVDTGVGRVYVYDTKDFVPIQIFGENINDKFGTSCSINNEKIHEDDVVFITNFRADRARQITKAIVGQDFTAFDRVNLDPHHVAVFTEYFKDIKANIGKNILFIILQLFLLQYSRLFHLYL